MRVTLGAAKLVEDQIARNLQQPGREFGSWDVATRAFPDSDEYLLRDVFHVRIAAQHARHRASHQSLVFLDQFFERSSVASADKPHEAHVMSVFFRSPFVSAIVARHRFI
jgi:predicted HD phosphohydrolase